MAPDIYSSITAEWDIAPTPVTNTLTLDNEWIVKGIIRHSQYNTPLESACKGSSAHAWVFDSNCNFYNVKEGNQTGFNSNFMDQVYENGTGQSADYGLVKYCNPQWPLCQQCMASPNYPSGATQYNTFLMVPNVTGACLTPLIPNTSVATFPAPTNILSLDRCGNTIFLAADSDTTEAIKYIGDLCPACSGGYKGTNGHIDNYVSSQACEAWKVKDFGKFWTADTQRENQ